MISVSKCKVPAISTACVSDFYSLIQILKSSDALKKLKTYKIPATLIFYYLSSKHWGGCLELTTIKNINNENIAFKVKEGLNECTDFGVESHECLIQKTRLMLAIGFIFYLYMCLEWAYPFIEECYFSEIGFSNFRFLVVMIQIQMVLFLY